MRLPVSKSAMLIRRSAHDVFEAITDPSVTTRWTFSGRRSVDVRDIVESGLAPGDMDICEQAIGSAQGVTFLLSGMKAWPEHGIELNLMTDAHPDQLVTLTSVRLVRSAHPMN